VRRFSSTLHANRFNADRRIRCSAVAPRYSWPIPHQNSYRQPCYTVHCRAQQFSLASVDFLVSQGLSLRLVRTLCFFFSVV
jgi:hypothetical protein